MTTKAKNRLSQSYQSSPCFTFRRLPSVASGKQYYEVHDGVFNWAGSTLAVPDFGPVYGVHLTRQRPLTFKPCLAILVPKIERISTRTMLALKQ